MRVAGLCALLLVAACGGAHAKPTTISNQAPATSAPVIPEPTASDYDGDGIAGDNDACPDDPEDFDGFQDADGCPEPDNDQDGVVDVDDACPMDPEDLDNVADSDGCPDP
jgi:hypothetical protein